MLWAIAAAVEITQYCRTGFDGDGLTVVNIATENPRSQLALDCTIETMLSALHIGVAFPFVGSLLLSIDSYCKICYYYYPLFRLHH